MPHEGNGGRLEVAQCMAGYSNAKTTGLYDRRNDDISVGELEGIGDLRKAIGNGRGSVKCADCKEPCALESRKVLTAVRPPAYFPRNFTVRSATRLPKAAAMVRSSGVGCNSPLAPDTVDAP